jgi:2-polyprenyl-3-methyl-5-hydroxy-6-metoxy-1,4-benzoquinol methylase
MSMEDPAEQLHRATEGGDYAQRLVRVQRVWWKRLLPVQAPYRWNLRRQQLGRTLDVGCGIGRNLAVLPEGSVGVDHNVQAVQLARASGLTAMTPEEFFASGHSRRESFDGMLLAHVVEHLDTETSVDLLRTYLPYLVPGGKVFLVCPQERGYASDPTHVRFTTGDDLAALCREVGLVPGRWLSFPFPRWAGRAFTYNEFCLLARKPN